MNQLIHPFCEDCDFDEVGTTLELRVKGWRFDVDGADICPKHYPVREDVTAESLGIILSAMVIAIGVSFCFAALIR